MALATLNGLCVLEARVHLPREGRWWADLAVDTDDPDAVRGGATLILGDALELRGTTVRAGLYAGSVTLQVVGGAGGLHKELVPKAYQGVPLRLPLQDALGEVGEALAPSSDPATLNVLLGKWVRMRGEAAGELECLLAEAPPGTTCRVLPDGTVWVGQETWPEARLEHTLLRDLGWCGQVELGVEEPSLLPGTLFLGRQVEHVEHRLSARDVRTIVQFARDTEDEPGSTTDGDRLLAVLDRRLRPSRFHQLYPAKVVKQNDDLTLELVLDDDIAPGLSNVPMRTFVPGARVKVAAETRCGVKFEGGDPQRPVATLFELGSLIAVEVTATDMVVFKAAKAVVDAPEVLLGGQSAAEALVLGTSFRAADASFDAALVTACSTASSTLAANTMALGSAAAAFTNPATAGVPATHGEVGALVACVTTMNGVVTSLVAAIQAAAQAKEGGNAVGEPSLFLSKTTVTN